MQGENIEKVLKASSNKVDGAFGTAFANALKGQKLNDIISSLVLGGAAEEEEEKPQEKKEKKGTSLK